LPSPKGTNLVAGYQPIPAALGGAIRRHHHPR
jgi:hypothetical protein